MAVATLFAVASYPTAAKLVTYWIVDDTYSFGFFIPLLSLVMVWGSRGQLRNARWSPSLVVGGLVTACGLGLLLAGRASATNIVEELSLVVSLCGLTLLLFGRTAFRILLFPLVYLLAMIPVWEMFLVRLHPYFQLYSATVGVRVLRLFGIPVFRDGTSIYLPNVSLQVAQACSGVNYLVAVVAIGLAVGHVFIRSWAKRLFVVGAAAAIALLSNALRVAVVAAFAYYGVRGENGDIHGPFALARSLVVSGIGYAALFALTTRFADRGITSFSQGRVAEPWTAGARHRWMMWRGASIAIVLLGCTLLFDRVWPVANAPLGVSLTAAIPEQVGPWHSRPWGSDTSQFPRLNFDDSLQRTYAIPSGDELSLFVGYIQRQAQGRELVGYDMHRALRADQSRQIVLDDGTAVNDVVVTEGIATYHVIYWYVGGNRVFAKDLDEKLHSAWRAMIHRQNNGALFVVRTRANTAEGIDEPLRRVRGFVSGMVSLSAHALTAPQAGM